jgi:hypothetical protein
LGDEEVIFEWTSHPLRQKPGKALLFWVMMGLVLGAVYAAFHQVGWVILAALLLLGSLSDFLFPTRYRVTTSGIEIRRKFGKTMRRWSDFRRADFERFGVFLSPFAKPHRLENYRGVFLPYPMNREQLEAIVREKLQRGASTDDDSAIADDHGNGAQFSDG